MESYERDYLKETLKRKDEELTNAKTAAMLSTVACELAEKVVEKQELKIREKEAENKKLIDLVEKYAACCECKYHANTGADFPCNICKHGSGDVEGKSAFVFVGFEDKEEHEKYKRLLNLNSLYGTCARGEEKQCEPNENKTTEKDEEIKKLIDIIEDWAGCCQCKYNGIKGDEAPCNTCLHLKGKCSGFTSNFVFKGLEKEK